MRVSVGVCQQVQSPQCVRDCPKDENVIKCMERVIMEHYGRCASKCVPNGAESCN